VFQLPAFGGDPLHADYHLHVVETGRHPLTGLTITFKGRRAEEHLRRFESMVIHFVITGDVPDPVVERAIDLSRHKYCSVWNTIRPDVQLTTTFTIGG
jgi:putative redox protein